MFSKSSLTKFISYYDIEELSESDEADFEEDGRSIHEEMLVQSHAKMYEIGVDADETGTFHQMDEEEIQIDDSIEEERKEPQERNSLI